MKTYINKKTTEVAYLVGLKMDHRGFEVYSSVYFESDGKIYKSAPATFFYEKILNSNWYEAMGISEDIFEEKLEEFKELQRKINKVNLPRPSKVYCGHGYVSINGKHPIYTGE